MRSSLNEKLLQKLEAFYQKKTVRSNPPYIREIIAYQKNNRQGYHPTGEFDETLVTRTNAMPNNFRNESEADIVSRMASYIQTLTESASKIHLATNFSNVDGVATMDANKTNNITRLSLNEFALYPNKDRGPLTIEGFNKLIEYVNQIAQNHPENLHLLLASVPVKNSKNQVHNMAIFVQCGSEPILHTFAKAYPDSGDPSYPNMENLIHSSDLPTKQISQAMIDIHFLKEGLEKNTITSEQASVDFHNILTIYPESYTLFEDFKNNKSMSSASLSPQVFQDFFLFLREKIKVPSVSLSDTDIEMNVNYGCNFTYKTAGGVLLRLAADICLDHFFGVSKSQIDDETKLIRSSGENTIPHYVSHSVVSNSISIKSAHLVSETVSQADPEISSHDIHPYMPNPEAIQEIINPQFGSHTVLKVYPSRELTLHAGNLNTEINAHHLLISKLQALRHYRIQRPNESQSVQVELEKVIVNFFNNEFDRFNGSEISHTVSNADDLIKKFLLLFVLNEKELKPITEILFNLLKQENITFETDISFLSNKDTAFETFPFENDLEMETHTIPPSDEILMIEPLEFLPDLNMTEDDLRDSPTMSTSDSISDDEMRSSPSVMSDIDSVTSSDDRLLMDTEIDDYMENKNDGGEMDQIMEPTAFRDYTLKRRYSLFTKDDTPTPSEKKQKIANEQEIKSDPDSSLHSSNTRRKS